MERKRFAQMDALRAIAAMAVVMIHATANAPGRWAVCCNQLARFSVPLFLMLSGFGHAQMYLHEGQLCFRGGTAPAETAQAHPARIPDLVGDLSAA